MTKLLRRTREPLIKPVNARKNFLDGILEWPHDNFHVTIDPLYSAPRHHVHEFPATEENRGPKRARHKLTHLRDVFYCKMKTVVQGRDGFPGTKRTHIITQAISGIKGSLTLFSLLTRAVRCAGGHRPENWEINGQLICGAIWILVYRLGRSLVGYVGSNVIIFGTFW